MLSSSLRNKGACTALGLLAISSFASADITFGGTRAQGMGGAGLALPIDIASNYRMNPAFLGIHGKTGKKFGFEWPSIGFRTDGINLSDVKDFIGNVNEGGVAGDKLIRLAKTFSRDRTELGLNGSVGVVFGNMGLSVLGEADVTSIPNAALQSYGGSGTPATGSQLDAYGLGYYSVNVGVGFNAPTKVGNLAIGATGKMVKEYYSHQFVRWTGGGDPPGATLGSEMGGKNALDKSGFGLDLGALYSPPQYSNLYIGAVVENIIQPDVNFTRQLPDSPATKDDVRIFKRAIDLGVGAKLSNKVLGAIDFIDIGNNAGRSQIGAGAELMVTSWLGARAGYNSRTGFTVGVTLGGLNLTLAGKTPVMAAAAFRF